MSFSHVRAVCSIVLDTAGFVNTQGGDIDQLMIDLNNNYMDDIRNHIGSGVLTTRISEVIVDRCNNRADFTEDPCSGVLHANITLDVLFENAKENGVSQEQLGLRVEGIFDFMANEGQLSSFDDIHVDEWEVETSSDLRSYLENLDVFSLQDYAKTYIASETVDYLEDGQFYLGHGKEVHSKSELAGMLFSQMQRLSSEQNHYVVYVDEVVGDLTFDSRFLTSIPLGVSIEETIDSIMRNWHDYSKVTKDGDAYFFAPEAGWTTSSSATVEDFQQVSEDEFKVLIEYMRYIRDPAFEEVDEMADGLSPGKSSHALGM